MFGALRAAVLRALHRVEHGDRGVEVVEARVDQVERDDLATEDLADLAVAVARGAETGAGQDHVADEQEVSLASLTSFGITVSYPAARNHSAKAGDSPWRSTKRNSGT